MLKRPQNVVDVMRRRGEPYLARPRVVNLHGARVSVVSLRYPAAYILSALTAGYFLFSSVFSGALFAPTGNALFAAENSEERAALEVQLRELETQIAEYESTVQQYKKQGDTLKGEIDRLNANIAKLNLQIKAVNLSISQIDKGIRETQTDIEVTENDISLHKEAIMRLLRSINESESETIIEILLANPQLSDFFGNINDIMLVESNLRVELKKVIALRVDLIDKKETLALQRNDAETLRTYQASQRSAVASTKSEKDKLLLVTKGQESRYQVLLTETKKTAAEIRSRIFQLIGGGELTFEKAYELAKFASDLGGIRPALVLAVLDKESALGRNVGQCLYDQNPYYPDRASNQTTMHPTRDIPVFLEIVKKLGLEQSLANGILKVSCPIPRDGAFGGAMGPAQFIPSTWAIYASKIEELTGTKPANPWRNLDAFLATALYLKDSYNSRDCVSYGTTYAHVLPKNTLQERCAAAKYYSGGNWFQYRFAYGDPVLERADSFEEDIAILTGQ